MPNSLIFCGIDSTCFWSLCNWFRFNLKRELLVVSIPKVCSILSDWYLCGDSGGLWVQWNTCSRNQFTSSVHDLSFGAFLHDLAGSSYHGGYKGIASRTSEGFVFGPVLQNATKIVPRLISPRLSTQQRQLSALMARPSRVSHQKATMQPGMFLFCQGLQLNAS